MEELFPFKSKRDPDKGPKPRVLVKNATKPKGEKLSNIEVRIPMHDSVLFAIITLEEEDGGATTTTRGKREAAVWLEREGGRRV